MAYNQSRIKQFRRCQRQYAFRYDSASVLGYHDENAELVPKRKKIQLERGTWLHKLLEAHNQSWAGVKKPDRWKKVHAKLTRQFEALFDEEKDHLGDMPGECERLFRGYLREWEKDSDRYTVARLHDGQPAIEAKITVPLRKYGISDPFKGTVDLLVEDNDLGGLWIRDYKSVKSIPNDDERMMSPQNCMYVWALRKKGYDIRGFVYDYIRTKPPTIPHVLKRSSQYGAAGTLSQAGRMDTDYYTYLQAIKDAHGENWKKAAQLIYKGKLIQLRERQWMWYRSVPIPVEDSKVELALQEFLATCRDIERRDLENPPRSYFYSCKWGCDYHELCTATFAGLDVSDMVKMDYTFEDERYSETEAIDLMKE